MSYKTITDLISPKVLAATGGAGIGAATSQLVIWLVGVHLFHVPGDAAHQAQALAAVPTVVSIWLTAVLAIIGAWVPGWASTDPVRQQVADAQVPPDDHTAAPGPQAEPDEPIEPEDTRVDGDLDDSADAGAFDDTPDNEPATDSAAA